MTKHKKHINNHKPKQLKHYSAFFQEQEEKPICSQQIQKVEVINIEKNDSCLDCFKLLLSCIKPN